MKRFLTSAFVFFLILVSFQFAYTISGKIKGGMGASPVALAGTTAELWNGKYLISKTTADSFGQYSLSADEGEYLIFFKRDGYPDHVYSVSLLSDKNLDLFMQKSAVFLYGQVMHPTSLKGKEIALYKDGVIFSKTRLQDDGEYAFVSLMPGKYNISVDLGDYKKKIEVTLAEKTSLRLDFSLDKKSVDIEPSAGQYLTAPQGIMFVLPEKVKKGEMITGTLFSNSSPLGGARIEILTPSYERIVRTTDYKGEVRVVALENGIYRFFYLDTPYLVFAEDEDVGWEQPQSEIAEPLPPKEVGSSAEMEQKKTEFPQTILLFIGGFIVIVTFLIVALLYLVKKRKLASSNVGGGSEKASTPPEIATGRVEQVREEQRPLHSKKKK
ncbi:MAG: hypothetical protein QXW70_02745 [Candidatus Anstonellales archaeon]